MTLEERKQPLYASMKTTDRAREFGRKIPLFQIIYQELRAQIIAMVLRPGTSLNRKTLAQHYGASPSPLRDALLRLEGEGLVVIYPQSRTEVSLINLNHARETQFLRLGLELEVARQLALSSNPSVKTRKAGYALAMLREAVSYQDDVAVHHWDAEFHFALCKAAGYPDLWTLITDRSGHIDRLRLLNLPDPGKRVSILHDHEQILAAIRSGNVDAALCAVREHLSGTLKAADDLRDRFPDYVNG